MSKATYFQKSAFHTSPWTATLSRWIDLLLVVVVALVVCLVSRPWMAIASDHFSSTIVDFPLFVQLTIICMLAACVWLPVIRLGGFRCKDLINGSLLYYPPTWFGGLIGSVAFIVVVDGLEANNSNATDPYTWISSTLSGALLFPVSILLALISNGFAIRRRNRRSTEFNSGPDGVRDLVTDPQKLNTWIHSETPIEHPADDYLDYKTIALRISNLIANDAERHIGLVGPHGSGKSSLLNLIRYNLNILNAKRHSRRWTLRHSWHFCRLDAWGREPEHFSEQLLRAMVESLGRSVDVLSIFSMPKHYTKAISASGSAWLSMPSALLSATTDPITCLCRMDNILRATRSRMLIFIEDLDRNVSHDFLNAQLPALLDRIRNLEYVYFVFAIGSEKDSAQSLMRITQHLESIDSNNRAHTKVIITAFRNYCINRYQFDIDPVAKEKRASRFRLVSKSIVDPFRIEGFLNDEYPGTHDLVADALSNPRVLKQVLRRVNRAWDALHGEIDFDDLFIVHLLRYVYKDAYAFLLNNLNAFRSVNDHDQGDADIKRKRAALAQELEAAVQAKDIKIVDNLIQSLFPAWKDQRAGYCRNSQGIRHSVPTDYWNRLQQEWIDPAELRDQHILQAIAGWQQNGSVAAADDHSLAKYLYSSREASAKVLHFSHMLSEEEIHLLASDVNSIILSEHACDAYGESNHAFTDLWRASLDRIWEGHDQWLIDELEKALPASLQFANDLYDTWRIQTHNDISANPLTTDLYHAYIDAAKQLWEADIGKLIAAISYQHPNALYLFVIEYSNYERTDTGFKYDRWRWCFDLMANALEHSPVIMALHFVPFMVYQPTNLSRGYCIRIQSSQKMFGDRLLTVLNLLKNHLVPENHEGAIKQQIALLKYFCQEWIAAQSLGNDALNKLIDKYERNPWRGNDFSEVDAQSSEEVISSSHIYEADDQ